MTQKQINTKRSGQSFLGSVVLLATLLICSCVVLWIMRDPEEKQLGRAYQLEELPKPQKLEVHRDSDESSEISSSSVSSASASAPSTPGLSANDEALEAKLREVQNLKDAGSLDESLALLTKLQEADPNNESLLMERAMFASREQNDPATAKIYLEKVLTQNPAQLEAADELFYSYKVLEDFGGGIRKMQELAASAEGSDKAGINYVLGRLLLESGMIEDGKAKLEEAAAGGSNNPMLREQLANAYGASGDYQKARETWENLARDETLSFSSFNAKTKVAQILESEGKYDEARQKLEELLAVSPGHPEGTELLSRINQRHPAAN